MKAKQTITASAAFAALAMAWWNRHQTATTHKAEMEQKCAQDALATFEGEGGLVLS
jgi:hypothetical protein